ncbi:MAG: family 43 glycosylhydrolase, partial [Spirochaetota bacterium]
DGLSLTGELETVYAGWRYPDDWRVEGFFVEGPKLVQREGWYYLTSAQGGTAGPATSHMAVVARSRSPLGPWENSPYNPLVHTWSRGEEWWSTGHATIFDTPHGDSYAAYHGYRAGMHTLGRQTLVAPVHWNAGWPVVDLGDRCDQDGPVAGGLVRSLVPMDPSDDFDSPSLGVQWRRFDLLPTDHIESGAGSLRIRCSGTRGRPPQPLVCTPGDVVYRVEVTVGRTELTDDACAGLVLYYDERCFAGLLVDGKGRVIVAREGAITSRVLAEEADQTVRLAIVNDRHEVEFHLREHDGWRRLDAALDVAGYNHNVFGRFLSLRAGLMAVGTGTATFSMFRYESGVGI